MIDADILYGKFIDGETDTEQEKSANQLSRYLIRHSPTIDPETLPIVKELRDRLEKAENIASDLCDDFTDFVTGGVHNAAPYCANKRPECVNSHGWCNGDNRVCKGFLPKAAVMEE